MSATPFLEDHPERLREWLRAHEMRGFIKLRPEEFDALPDGPEFWHINAAPCTHVAGESYALVRMARPSAGERTAPLLDLSQTLRVRCMAVVELRDSREVLEEQLLRLIGGCASRAELTDMLHRRYRHTKGWGLAEATTAPVVLTLLQRSDVPA